MHLPLKQDAFVLLSVSSMAKSVPNTYTDHFMNSNMLKIHLFPKKKKKKQGLLGPLFFKITVSNFSSVTAFQIFGFRRSFSACTC